MNETHQKSAIQDLLGSVHVLSFAMEEIVEEGLLRKVAGGQMTISQLRLLRLVSLPGTHTITEVAAFMGISKAAASKAADRLVRSRLMRRTEGERDRRAAFLSLTPAGRRIVDAFSTARERLIDAVAQNFDSEEFQGAIRLLDNLAARLIDQGTSKENVCVRCRIHFVDKCLLQKHLERECEYEVQRQRFREVAGEG